MLALVGVAFFGLYLPGLARLALVAVGAVVVRLLPEGSLRLSVGLVVGWLALAWGSGLLSPVVGVALVVLIGVEVRLWWDYHEATADLDVEEPTPPPRDPTPDERLDAILDEAPLEGLAFGEIVEAMRPHMGRTAVYKRLKRRAWSIDGRWRTKPAGIDGDDR